MCMIHDASPSDVRQEEEDEHHNENGNGGGRGAGADVHNNGGGVQEYVMVTALDQDEAASSPAHWHSADVEEAETSAMAMEDDMQFGYLQISSDNSARSVAAEHDNGNQDASGGQRPSHGNTAGQAHGIQVANPGSAVTNGREVQSRIVTVNGLQLHVFGNVSGLELLDNNPVQAMDLETVDSEEEEEERRRVAGERAIAEADAADAARRTAPLSPEHRTQIVNAMKGINLGGFRPTWADSVPEDQWIHRIKERGNTR